MEEAPFLMAVQRVVGGVEVEGDLRRRHGMSVEKDIDKHGFDQRRVVTDFVIARGLRPAQLQPVERRFAGQGRAIRAFGLQLATQHRHHRVMAQLIVVDQILVAQRDPEYPLTDQARHRVLDQIGRAVIGEAPGKPRHQPDRPVGGTQQHCPGLRGHLAAIESGHHRAPFNRCKSKQIRATLCPHRASPCLRDKPFLQHDFLRSRAPMHLPPLRNPG